MHGIYVDPNTQKGLEAKNFLRNMIGENTIRCVVQAYTYQGIGTLRCFLGGEDINLTKKEFEILSLFLANKGIVFTREEILNKVWKGEVIVLDRTIDVNITRLRKKIGEYGQRIVTRLGYGYCFECE